MVFTPNYLLLPLLIGSSVDAHPPSLDRSVTPRTPTHLLSSRSRSCSLILLFINAGPLYLRWIDFHADLFTCHLFEKIILPILPPSILNEYVATVIRWKFDIIVAVASNATGAVVFFFLLQVRIIYCNSKFKSGPVDWFIFLK